MGGVVIKNCTAVPIMIELCQAGPLYWDLVQPGDNFIRNTGAVHFTIRLNVSDENNAGWWNRNIVKSLADMATNGVKRVVDDAPRLVEGSHGGQLTKDEATRLFSKAEEGHCYLSSGGWYFGGKNELNIRGGPKIVEDSKGFRYEGSPLRIVDKNDESRHN